MRGPNPPRHARAAPANESSCVTERLGEIRQHGVEDGGVHRSCRVVIEIEAHVESLPVFRIAVHVGAVKAQVEAGKFDARMPMRVGGLGLRLRTQKDEPRKKQG